MFDKLFDKKSGSEARASNKLDVNANEVLAQELYKRKVHGRLKFKNNIWATDLAKMGYLCSKNWCDRLLSYVVDVFTKDAWGNPLTDKKSKAVFDGFIGIVNESKHKPSKLWVDQERELYKSLMQKWLDNNHVLM